MMKLEDLNEQVNKHNAILYMKGTPETAGCGFSRKICFILSKYNAEYVFVDVIANPYIRANLNKISNWPTFPQFFIKGKLVGGSDIINEYHQEGKLEKILLEADLIKDDPIIKSAM